MSWSQDYAWHLQDLRDGQGTTVTFNGIDYRVTTESVSGAKVGVQNLPDDALGVYIASADPRVFRFSPQYFQPITDVRPPQEGNELIWHGLRYRITLANYDDADEDTNGLNVFAYRQVV